MQTLKDENNCVGENRFASNDVLCKRVEHTKMIDNLYDFSCSTATKEAIPHIYIYIYIKLVLASRSN